MTCMLRRHTLVLNDEQLECITETAVADCGEGVRQMVRALTLDPASTSNWMTSEWPASTARWSGVTPASRPSVIVASVTAPASISTRTTPACPACAATCSAVTSPATPPRRMRSVARPVTSHPAATSSPMTRLWRCWAASRTGVTQPGPGRLTSQHRDCSSSRVRSARPFHAAMCSADQPLTCTHASTTIVIIINNDIYFARNSHTVIIYMCVCVLKTVSQRNKRSSSLVTHGPCRPNQLFCLRAWQRRLRPFSFFPFFRFIFFFAF